MNFSVQEPSVPTRLCLMRLNSTLTLFGTAPGAPPTGPVTLSDSGAPRHLHTRRHLNTRRHLHARPPPSPRPPSDPTPSPPQPTRSVNADPSSLSPPSRATAPSPPQNWSGSPPTWSRSAPVNPQGLASLTLKTGGRGSLVNWRIPGHGIIVRDLDIELQNWPRITFGAMHPYGISSGIALRVF